ncbi:hypothetical protein EAS61_41645 [Bradyrhizobium zhanjiangense]|uniref:Uncharacterized protein n=1 Tax=Bradyrhizobium zhanjiangense TaxID=1325107 RepID=A0A4Q0Q4K5_9BRAD|nr:hypothetical protein EAS61_41645 [Bradyrhizobium zhanjiangense]
MREQAALSAYQKLRRSLSCRIDALVDDHPMILPATFSMRPTIAGGSNRRLDCRMIRAKGSVDRRAEIVRTE